MICPNCENGVTIEDYEDTEPFQCSSCNEWLILDIDEGTYFGATYTTLRIFDIDYD
ncbi:hypothetical protein [Acinetobacter nectaris]|uniref:hypothetical protein n=1 Tax=Acinetobacter nectaris TaxID=1219382 RepID=UPI001F248A73|nr:hypothetical protein [Acinetobacter nectaris]MCF8999671.1 hypothetical protein [Acinetobacter nectaris]MCF9028294.1 hypothetical protein [Acinetobacter nectaris]